MTKTLAKCPECQQIEPASLATDALGHWQESKPLPGDTSICAHCGILLHFEESGRWRRKTPEEIKLIPLEFRIMLGRLRLQIELSRARNDH